MSKKNKQQAKATKPISAPQPAPARPSLPVDVVVVPHAPLAPNVVVVPHAPLAPSPEPFAVTEGIPVTKVVHMDTRAGVVLTGGDPGEPSPVVVPPAPPTPEELAEIEHRLYEAGVTAALDGFPVLPEDPEAFRKGHAAVDPETKLRLDGPTPDQYVAAGYPIENYPPQGYKAKVNPPALPPAGHLSPLGQKIDYKPIFGGYPRTTLLS